MIRNSLAVPARPERPVRDQIYEAARIGARGVVVDAIGDLAPHRLSETGRREVRHILRTAELALAAVSLPTRRPFDTTEQPRRPAADAPRLPSPWLSSLAPTSSWPASAPSLSEEDSARRTIFVGRRPRAGPAPTIGASGWRSRRAPSPAQPSRRSSRRSACHRWRRASTRRACSSPASTRSARRASWANGSRTPMPTTRPEPHGSPPQPPRLRLPLRRPRLGGIPRRPGGDRLPGLPRRLATAWAGPPLTSARSSSGSNACRAHGSVE